MSRFGSISLPPPGGRAESEEHASRRYLLWLGAILLGCLAVILAMPGAWFAKAGFALGGGIGIAAAFVLIAEGFQARRRPVAVCLHMAGLVLLYEVFLLVRLSLTR